jgi:signal transduction histidine kinase
MGEAAAVAETIILMIAFSVVTALSIRAVPHNGAVWAMIWAMFFGMAGELGATIGVSRTGFTTPEIEQGLVVVAPSEIDGLASIGFAIALSAWVVAVFLLGTHLLILFPRGSAVSVPWRWVAWASALSMAAIFISTVLAVAPWVDTPYDEIYESEMGAAGVFGFLMLVLMLIAVASLVHLVRRFWRSVGEERLQYRWVTWSLAFQVLIIFGFSWLPGSSLLSTVVLALVPVSFGIAIMKYRLYDIDVVINRTIVFVLLAAFITAVYAIGVVAVGSLLGGSSVWLAMTATAVVAIAFEPVRARAQRLANRLVYGKRATPYEVLSELSRRLPDAEDEVGLLDRMAEQLALGTGAEPSAVWLAEGDRFERAASFPTDPADGESLRWVELPGYVVSIEHDAELLGALTVELPTGSALHPAELRLIEDLAGSAGLVVRKLRLDAELEATARDLESSRRRLVEAQDLERRKLERDLNDGAQQNVLGLKVKLALVARVAAEENSGRTAALLEQMTEDAQAAIVEIGDLAKGIYPPHLESEGLGGALRALAAGSAVDVDLVGKASRYPLEVEAAAYFCISEAMTNSVKHGTPPIRIEIEDDGRELAFSVSDEGPGFNQSETVQGVGLVNMADRIDSVGGQLSITSSTGGGTTVNARIPIPAMTGSG